MMGVELLLTITVIVVCAAVLALALARAVGVGRSRRKAETVRPADPTSADYDGIRARVERRYRRRYELAAHVVIFFFVVGGLWMLWVPPTALALLGGAWALVLVVHGVQVIFAESTDRAIEREIERERARVAGFEKPKRDRYVRLSDEGELIDVVEDEWDDGEKQKRQG